MPTPVKRTTTINNPRCPANPKWPLPYFSSHDGRGLVRLYHGHVTDVLQTLPAQSVQCCVTSPPYWGLRAYLKDEHESKSYEIGSEPSPDCKTDGKAQCGKCFVCAMVSVFRGVKRVLRDDGTLWLNLGDSYAGGSGGRGDIGNIINGTPTRTTPVGDKRLPIPSCGIPSGNLVGVPWRVALALQADGWILRQDIIWHKPSPMPESVRNRCTKAHEYVFLFTKGMGYYYDEESIKDGVKGQLQTATWSDRKAAGAMKSIDSESWKSLGNGSHHGPGMSHDLGGSDGRANKRSVWTVSAQGYPGAHFACVDEQTEALTLSGWKQHTNLTDGEQIAAYDQTLDRLVWQPATFHRYPYSGNLIKFSKRDTSQVLTPNHRCLVKHRGKKSDYTQVKRADEVGQRDSFLMTAEFDETPTESIGTDMAALVGWYTSEGHLCYKSSRLPVAINQSVTANKPKVDEIDRLLHRMGATYRVYYKDYTYNGVEKRDAVFRVGGKVASQLLRLCPHKEVTDELTRLPIPELEALLDAFVKGDGNTRRDGRKQIVQKSLTHLSRLQVIALKLGYRAHIAKREDVDCHAMYLTRGRWLNVRGTNGKWKGTPYVGYEGVVWCPSVDSSFWLARRDGKPFITGNTFPPKLIEPMILAGTSEKGMCAQCGNPWKRILTKPSGGATGKSWHPHDNDAVKGNAKVVSSDGYQKGKTLGWHATCRCGVGKAPVPCVVLDPFMGSGTTAEVCLKLGRAAVGIDLNKEYIDVNAKSRINRAWYEYQQRREMQRELYGG